MHMLKSNQKFAIVSINNLSADIDKPIRLSKSFYVLPNPPVEIDEIWGKWLGSLTTEAIKNANIFILALKDSDKPQILDDENKALTDSVSKYFFSLFFIGSLYYESAYIVTGAKEDKEISIRQFYKNKRYYQNDITSTYNLLQKDFHDAYNIKNTLFKINNSNEFQRFKHGVSAFQKALTEDIQQYRLHQFVRSIEALIIPPIGETKKKFIHRCHTFVKSNKKTRNILEEIYDLRCAVEHMNDWKIIFKDLIDNKKEEIALERSKQVEILARKTYNYILQNENILKIFKDDDTLISFWKNNNEKQRKEIWKNEINLQLT